jgi:hypothetical protein
MSNKTLAEMSAPELRDFAEKLVKASEKAKNARADIDNLTSAMGRFVSTGAKSTEAVGNISTAYGDMQKTLKATTSITTKLTGMVGAFTGKMRFLGPVAGAAGTAIAGIGQAFGMLANGVAEAPRVMITALDDQTRGLRQFEAEIFSLHKRFGGTIGEAENFADSMRLASNNDLAKNLHLTSNEMAKFVRQTANTSLTQEQLSKTVQTGAGVIELFGAATAFAASTNMSYSQTAGIMNTLMNKQGKSAQEATNMLGMFIGVAEETGLSIDKVANSLNSAVGNFAKIGMAADFGRPIMEGFAKTMKDMGLGIEESIGLSNGLTGALAGLTNNYGMAYLTFQRGGLDIGGGGGGGVLGSSIALQNAYLDAEDAGDQGAISDQLVRGMKDTLASFTGGDIVTSRQAGEDSSLNRQYYIQQQMLKSNFGISDDNSAARVLDMLSQLDEATRTGDKDSQAKLKEQIEREAGGRDKTLDEMEKVNRKLETQINVMTVGLRNDLDQTRLIAASVGGFVSKHTGSVVGGAAKGVELQGAALSRMAKFLGLKEGSKAHKAWDEFRGLNPIDAVDSPMNRVGAADAKKAIKAESILDGGKGDKDLLGVLGHALGSGGNKRTFEAGSFVNRRDVERVAAAVAEKSKNTEEDKKKLSADMALAFEIALERLFKENPIRVDLTPAASELVRDAKGVTRPLKGPSR